MKGANLDHVVPRKKIFDNNWRKIADIETADLANKRKILGATPMNRWIKSKGATSNSDYIKNRGERKKLRNQVQRANEKLIRKISQIQKKKNLKAENEKRLNDKLAADSEKMLKTEKEQKEALLINILQKAPVKNG